MMSAGAEPSPREPGPSGPRTGGSATPAPRGAPPSYGLYVYQDGTYTPLGRVQSKVQFGKLRGLLGAVIPFIRQKVDVNVAGAHAPVRFTDKRPTFFAFFPPSRDVSKFKLLQAKITGQGFDQRTVASASVLFSAEQNQDEVPCDIGPTGLPDVYRIAPREDLPSGEYGFLEGHQGINTTANITILDVFDFGIDRPDDRKPLLAVLELLPAAVLPDRSYQGWTREQCQRVVDARQGKAPAQQAILGPFKRQWASLDVYWADEAFAKAFARLEMIERSLTPEQADKLVRLLVDPARDEGVAIVSIGSKVGSGRVIGANEGERPPRPYDATLSRAKGKDDEVVVARRVELVPGYAGLWRVTFERLAAERLASGAERFEFEARLNQSLGFKATFSGSQSGPRGS